MAELALKEITSPLDRRKCNFLLRRGAALSQLANPACSDDAGNTILEPDKQLDYIARAYDDYQNVMEIKGFECAEAVRGVKNLEFILKQLRHDPSKSKKYRNVNISGLARLREMRWPG
eukprot:gnl/MRDRNA2_/MRDRNA2_24365_c0_seq1.p1 gnl/MRDRNA2_/MRDRNA2_24365_c0~~gnl/MRDRNA2_/MRDRNA2_24365_c0_seq1.p1  ORF type:complete len:118 (+),score=24.05 gnl/MRDRNA2_/MRDRNA2_24365_c0_seq1:54-407(+)